MHEDAKCTDILKLHGQIEFMDSLSQAQCGEIEAIASTTLIAMRSAEFWRHPERVEGVMLAILGRAQDLMNSLNAEAEAVGCNFIDGNERMRHAAFYENRDRENADA
jgi:hypothetical protein